jgi:hypothetical protein
MSDVSHLFNTTVRFDGTLENGNGEGLEGRCKIVTNPIDPSQIEAQFSQDSASMRSVGERLKQTVGVHGQVQIEGELSKYQYLATGLVKRSHSDSQGIRYDLEVDDITEVEITPGPSKEEGLKQIARFYLAPFDKLLPAFKRGTSRHHRHGFIHGWRSESLSDFESGNWESSTREIEIGEYSVEVDLHFQFEQATASDAECEIVTPRIKVETELPEPVRPDTIRHVREEIKNVQNDLVPFWNSLRFALGRRPNPPCHELSTYDYEEEVAFQGRRFWNRNNEVETTPGRGPNANELWKLVEQLVRKFNELGEDTNRKAGKAVTRYVEAFEAPTAELKLTLMHSALHLIVTKDEYLDRPNDVVPDDVPTPNAGGVNWGLAKAIGILRIKWKDLFSGEVDVEEMYAFNRLRNDYLKRDKRGFMMGSLRPVRQLQRLFERVYLADLGIDPSDYPVLGRT